MTTATNWSAHTSFSEVKRRCGGRRAYNAERQRQAELRRRKVAFLMFRKGWYGTKGYKYLIARKLKVSYQTIVRDVQAVLREGWVCHACGHHVKPPSE
jgi:hypothetical protein